MKILLLVVMAFLIPSISQANLIFQYALNYSSEKDDTSDDNYEKTRMFHKVFLGASINTRRTVYFGWNINSWNSSLTKVSDEETYSMLEMGPRLTIFYNDNFNAYATIEWNPYAKGERDKTGTTSEISGSSTSIGLGYRFKLSRQVGLGAAIHYHNLSLDEEKIDSTEDDISNTITNIMPMLELTIITK